MKPQTTQTDNAQKSGIAYSDMLKLRQSARELHLAQTNDEIKFKALPLTPKK